MARTPTVQDLKIIAMLRHDARQPLARIAATTGVPVSTVYDKIKAHERSKAFIKRHTTIVDFPKLGFTIRTIVLAKSANRTKLAELARTHPNINSSFVTSGEYDLVLDCVFRYMHEYQEFVETIEGIADAHSILYVSDEPKKEGFLTTLEDVRRIDDEQGV